jgi:limonene-1,2-epoxide hydrolase
MSRGSGQPTRPPARWIDPNYAAPFMTADHNLGHDEPAEVVAAFIAAIERRDLEAAMALVDPHCEYDNVPIGPVHGHDAIRAVLEPVVARSDEIVWPVQRSAASGNVVFNERLDRFRTGERWIEIAVAGVWEVNGGLITLWRDYFDLDSYRKQAN